MLTQFFQWKYGTCVVNLMVIDGEYFYSVEEYYGGE